MQRRKKVTDDGEVIDGNSFMTDSVAQNSFVFAA